MEIMMFIIFIITNLIIILCMQFAYTHAYKYENGMYLNVHIPSSHKEDAEVTEIVTTGKRKMKHFQIANVIISIAICFIVFFNIAVFVLLYIIWMFAYIFGIIHIPNSSHRKMYALKIQNGWIIEAQRKKVYIDTRVSAEAGATTVSYKWHALFLITELAAYIPYFMLGDTHYNLLMISLFLCSVLVSTLSLVFHAFINKSERHVYSMDSKLNLIVNNTMKKYKSIAMLLLSGLNAVAWIYVALYTGITGIFPASSYYVYIFIQLIAGCIILVFVCMLPLINIQEKITLTNNNLTISAGGYTSEIDVNDITELKLLDELPYDGFLRTNGASTDSYDIGRYEGRTLGKCSLYVFDGYSPILMIKSDDTLVFVNSKENGEIERLYEELSQ